MKRSVSASNSHFEASISSGPVATVLLGPIEAVAMSLVDMSTPRTLILYALK